MLDEKKTRKARGPRQPQTVFVLYHIGDDGEAALDMITKDATHVLKAVENGSKYMTGEM